MIDGTNPGGGADGAGGSTSSVLAIAVVVAR
jgi:hypothetical protein